jgi:hypothetical protein
LNGLMMASIFFMVSLQNTPVSDFLEDGDGEG